MTKIKFPIIRISQLAHDHLQSVAKKSQMNGLSKSMSSLASEVILAIPMPNGNGTQPEIPCPDSGQNVPTNQETKQ